MPTGCADTNGDIELNSLGGNSYELCFTSSTSQQAFDLIKAVQDSLNVCEAELGYPISTDGDASSYNVTAYTGACMADLRVPIFLHIHSDESLLSFDETTHCMTFVNDPVQTTINGITCCGSSTYTYKFLNTPSDTLRIGSVLSFETSSDRVVNLIEGPLSGSTFVNGRDTIDILYEYHWGTCGTTTKNYQCISEFKYW